MPRNRQVLLARRPNGAPVRDDFALVDGLMPRPAGRQVLLRNLVLSIDPDLRGGMNKGKGSYAAPLALGAPTGGGTVAEVVESSDAAFHPGDLVLAEGGWQD